MLFQKLMNKDLLKDKYFLFILRTINNRPYGSLNIQEVLSFMQHFVGTSIARPFYCIG